jgi:hypothetical protein
MGAARPATCHARSGRRSDGHGFFSGCAYKAAELWAQPQRSNSSIERLLEAFDSIAEFCASSGSQRGRQLRRSQFPIRATDSLLLSRRASFTDVTTLR